MSRDLEAEPSTEEPANDGRTRLERDVESIDLDIREGRFQRWLSLIAGGAAALSAIEVSYKHYTGGYSRRIMYTPVILGGALTVTGIAGFFSRTAARTVLPVVSTITLVDCAAGFYFHVRGIARKPGGWRIPVANIVMGPPLFAPILFGISAYLGLIASFLRRGEQDGTLLPRPTSHAHWAKRLMSDHEPITWEQDIREGRFQKQMAVAAALSAFLSGFEAWYSHYKNNFQYEVQWSPLIITPLLMLAGAGAVRSTRVAHTWLPAISALAIIDGTVGFGYHVRGVLWSPGGSKKLVYNILYGPPVFAPLLFAASGFLGVLASLLRRDDRT
ncbi:MAG: hypothetical protein M3R44_03215 [Candidatus Eremiobacteraeota bacterium]|nr:hypothetical protein [Candidatus Eremiobacteraeota bacterium]